ncbi:MAG: hypothetical protein N3C59_01885 [Azovibrio sp.]|nr:hypothetical protein [Azovibrio sp.]
MTRNARINLLLFLLLALLLGLGAWLGPRLARSGEQVLPVVPCDLNRGPCALDLPGGGRLQVEITPRPIPVLQPLALQVSLAGRAAKTVRLDFSGVDMDMGFNQVSLRPLGGGRFAGQGNLPICITGAMRWQAAVLIETDSGSLSVPFHFMSGH